jgi:hypothetical protein
MVLGLQPRVCTDRDQGWQVVGWRKEARPTGCRPTKGRHPWRDPWPRAAAARSPPVARLTVVDASRKS